MKQEFDHSPTLQAPRASWGGLSQQLRDDLSSLHGLPVVLFLVDPFGRIIAMTDAASQWCVERNWSIESQPNALALWAKSHWSGIWDEALGAAADGEQSCLEAIQAEADLVGRLHISPSRTGVVSVLWERMSLLPASSVIPSLVGGSSPEMMLKTGEAMRTMIHDLRNIGSALCSQTELLSREVPEHGERLGRIQELTSLICGMLNHEDRRAISTLRGASSSRSLSSIADSSSFDANTGLTLEIGSERPALSDTDKSNRQLASRHWTLRSILTLCINCLRSEEFKIESSLRGEFLDWQIRTEIEAANFLSLLMNLILNSKEAGASSLELSLKVDASELSHEVLEQGKPQKLHGLFTLELNDNGPGFRYPLMQSANGESELPPSSKGAGRGLGLRSAKQWVERSKGQFCLGKSPTGGAQLLIKIPYYCRGEHVVTENDDKIEREFDNDQRDSNRAQSPGSDELMSNLPRSTDQSANRRILVVDDEVRLARLTAELISEFGYEGFAIGSVPQALEKVESWKPAVLILDVNLAPGERAIDLLMQLPKKEAPRVILSSGLSAEDLDNELSEHPLVCGFLEKPYGADELASVIESVGLRPKSAESVLPVNHLPDSGIR